MISLFRTNQPVNFITLPFLTMLLWLPAFWYVEPDIISGSYMPFSQWIVVPIQNMRVLGIVMAASLVCFGGFFLNYVVETNRLLSGRGMQVACCYVVLVGAFPQNLSFHPLHLTNLLLIWILGKILGFKRSESSPSKVFDAAFIIAISSLFYFIL